jgi:LDH2 family malate/lactate/ureidoglycolate dehydrogenase
LPQLHAFCCDILRAAGVAGNAAILIADSLTDAEARGLASHGLVRLLPVYAHRLRAGTTKAAPDIQIVERRRSAALVDGDSGPGQVVGQRAMSLAIEMAHETGTGVVGVRNSSHFGTSSFFVEQAVRANMIGMALTNAPANMPPAGGRSRYFGTNPLAIGLPCGLERPVILDMSTSVVARGKIVMAQKAGQELPPGWAIDEYGEPTQDAAAALRGAVLPMAGYKGAGMALMIDALCGVLTGAAFGNHIVDLYDQGDQPQNVGHFFVAIDIGLFMPVDAFKARMDQFIQEIRSQPRMPGVDRIFMPGEIEQETAEQTARTGVVVPEVGWRELDALARSLKVRPLGQRIEDT